MKKLFYFFILLSLTFYSFNTFADSLIYSNDFSTQKSFLNTEESHFYQGEYHMHDKEDQLLIWNPYFTPPTQYRAQVKMKTLDDPLDNNSSAGLLFRLKDKHNTLLFFIMPQSKRFTIGYWKKTHTSSTTPWINIITQTNNAIQTYQNLLDIIHLEEKSIFFINGKKVYEHTYPENDAHPYKGFLGFYTSANAHFHFDDFFVWKTQSPTLSNFIPVEDGLKKPSPHISNQYLKNYSKLGQEIYHYSFNNKLDSPFEEKPYAHIDLGKLKFFNTEETFLFSSNKIQEKKFLLETSFVLLNEKQNTGWGGILLKTKNGTTYFFKINPFLKKLAIERNQSSLVETTIDNINQGKENTLALKVNKKELTLYFNGKNITSFTEEHHNIEKEKNFGLGVTNTSSLVLFNYLRIFKIETSFFDWIGENFKLISFFILIALFIFVKKRNKKKKLAQTPSYFEQTKVKIIKETLHALSFQKTKRIFEKDLIFKYQMTKNQAQEVLEELSLKYGGKFDSDDEGNLYVSFD